MLKHLAEWLSMISAALLVSSYFNVRLDGIIWGFIVFLYSWIIIYISNKRGV